MYINELIHNNITYSVDMIRLKTSLTYAVFTEIEFRFKSCWKEYVKKYYTTPQLKQFFYNYIIEVGDNQSFWFGFCHNTERRSFYEGAEYNFTIEFNPNKLKDNKIIEYLLSLSGKWYIKSFDLAMDLKVNILDIITDIRGRGNSKIFSNGFDDKTICVGKGDGRIKIYNKKKKIMIRQTRKQRVKITIKRTSLIRSMKTSLKMMKKMPYIIRKKLSPKPMCRIRSMKIQRKQSRTIQKKIKR